MKVYKDELANVTALTSESLIVCSAKRPKKLDREEFQPRDENGIEFSFFASMEMPSHQAKRIRRVSGNHH
jgi:hypothetical protein